MRDLVTPINQANESGIFYDIKQLAHKMTPEQNERLKMYRLSQRVSQQRKDQQYKNIVNNYYRMRDEDAVRSNRPDLEMSNMQQQSLLGAGMNASHLDMMSSQQSSEMSRRDNRLIKGVGGNQMVMLPVVHEEGDQENDQRLEMEVDD